MENTRNFDASSLKNDTTDSTMMMKKKEDSSLVDSTKNDDDIIEAMWEEANTYWVQPANSTLTENVAKKILQGLCLESATTSSLMESIMVEHRHELRSAERLKLSFSLPSKFYSHFTPCKTYQWEVDWYDYHGCTRNMFGSMTCSPFVEDPPSITETTDAALDEYFDQLQTIRKTWNLVQIDDWEEECEQWLLGAYHGEEVDDGDLKWEEFTENIALEDVARCVVAGVGVLARQQAHSSSSSSGMHPGDMCPFANCGCVFKRVMLRLERELLTWGNDDAPDPTQEECSESISRRGGILSHPVVVEKLRREARWD